MTEPS
ncbi:hypothetical protein D043_0693A, partial [Vibrio parahaemolyticus EKP-021]|jgi:hypothetical protein